MKFTVRSSIAAAVPTTISAFADVLEFPQPKELPVEVNVVTETPAGSAIKYETMPKTGTIIAYRFQSIAVAYPAHVRWRRGQSL